MIQIYLCITLCICPCVFLCLHLNMKSFLQCLTCFLIVVVRNRERDLPSAGSVPPVLGRACRTVDKAPIEVPFHVSLALVPIQLPVNDLGKAMESGPSCTTFTGALSRCYIIDTSAGTQIYTREGYKGCWFRNWLFKMLCHRVS